MRPCSIESPSLGGAAGSGPAFDSTVGNTLRTPGERCQTTNTAAGRSGGNVDTSVSSAAMPPAEAPTTTMSLVATPARMQATRPRPAPLPVARAATRVALGGDLFHEQDRAVA